MHTMSRKTKELKKIKVLLPGLNYTSKWDKLYLRRRKKKNKKNKKGVVTA